MRRRSVRAVLRAWRRYDERRAMWDSIKVEIDGRAFGPVAPITCHRALAEALARRLTTPRVALAEPSYGFDLRHFVGGAR